MQYLSTIHHIKPYIYCVLSFNKGLSRFWHKQIDSRVLLYPSKIQLLMTMAYSNSNGRLKAIRRTGSHTLSNQYIKKTS